MVVPAAPRLVAFDLDGTLLDSTEAIVMSVKECWKACGFVVPKTDRIRRIIGLPWEESICELIPGAGEKEFTQIRQFYQKFAKGEGNTNSQKQSLFPGVLEVLNSLKSAGFLMAIITSRNSNRLEKILENHGINNQFVTFKTTDHGPGKPDPFLMLQTLEETGVKKENAVMVGDTTFDILMAVSAGTTGIGVSWGVHKIDELLEAGAERVVEEIGVLPEVIEYLIPR
ncbi:MAG: HAD-IA family hydrolase [Pseudomonadota bacterium]|nr:HAD-IA family hydrolase [Pseudomonadota bacterium]